ncbi:response regulator transcription factor [Agromyces sp. NPDC058136]|uniref:helix-turn-helix transcriptional regulator n=1 Tax=Agromyces sp. NPDC058136 TaxID=3346354 RepID=UPI0036D9F174
MEAHLAEPFRRVGIVSKWKLVAETLETVLVERAHVQSVTLAFGVTDLASRIGPTPLDLLVWVLDAADAHDHHNWNLLSQRASPLKLLGLVGSRSVPNEFLPPRPGTGALLPTTIGMRDFICVANELLDGNEMGRDRSGLSSRQTQVLRMVASGLTNYQIGTQLGIREGTVKRHLFEAYRVLNASSRLDAVNRARRAGLAV